MTFFDDVRDWHKVMNLRTNLPNQEDMDSVMLARLRLINEELSEMIESFVKEEWSSFWDGLADLTWVVIGTAVEFDVPFNDVWNEIKKSNFTKIGGKPDSGGKIMKPSTYIKPDIDSILRKKFNNETAGEHIHKWIRHGQFKDICHDCGQMRIK